MGLELPCDYATMATMSEVLDVEVRESRGSRAARKMRSHGKLPAVLYGHGGESVSLTLQAPQLEAAIRHGQKLVELKGGSSGQALIQHMQWDTFSSHVLHVDLMRVRAGERVQIEVPIEMRGMAPGAREGGVVEQLIHSVEIDVPIGQIPEKLHVNINDLQLHQSIGITEIEDMPKDAKLITSSEEVVVQCTEPMEIPEEEEAELGAAEPEIIGGKPEEEEDEGQGGD